MRYRGKERWLRRLALGLMLATVVGGGAAPAWAKFDEGNTGPRYAAAGGWSGQVDAESGIPLSAGIPERGDFPVVFTSSQRGQASEAAGSQRPSPVPADSSSSLAWREWLAFGIGAIVIALAVGVLVGQLRRPRVAGL